MRKEIKPGAVIVLVLVAILGVGLFVYQAAGRSQSEPQLVIRPANPDDPKYHPDPKLGLAGGPGTDAKGN